MLSLFRKLIHSRIGAVFALVFIGLLALAFAGADVTGPISTSTLPVPSVAALSGHSRAESCWTTNPQDPGLHDQRDQR